MRTHDHLANNFSVGTSLEEMQYDHVTILKCTWRSRQRRNRNVQKKVSELSRKVTRSRQKPIVHEDSRDRGLLNRRGGHWARAWCFGAGSHRRLCFKRPPGYRG